jgi:hypothetical protein
LLGAGHRYLDRFKAEPSIVCLRAATTRGEWCGTPVHARSDQ